MRMHETGLRTIKGTIKSFAIGKTKKAEKAKKGERYYCEVCGCEIVCTKPSEAAIVCCEEPMLLVL